MNSPPNHHKLKKKAKVDYLIVVLLELQEDKTLDEIQLDLAEQLYSLAVRLRLSIEGKLPHGQKVS